MFSLQTIPKPQTLFLVPTLVALFFLAAATREVAAAALPACTSPGYQSPAEVSDDEAPIGATRNLLFKSGYYAFDGSEPVIANFEAVPGGVVSHPYSVSLGGYPTMDTPLAVHFEPGDSSGRFRFDGPLRGMVGNDYKTCKGSLYSAPVNPVGPSKFIDPTPNNRAWSGGDYNTDTASIAIKPHMCGDGVVEVKIGYRRKSKTVRSLPGCIFGKPTSFSAFGFVDGVTKARSDLGDWVVDISSFEKKRFKSRKVTYTTTFNGQLVKRGRFYVSRVYNRRVPGYKIWDNEDDYWNVCVNDGRTTWSESGRFFCWERGVSAYWETRISKIS